MELSSSTPRSSQEASRSPLQLLRLISFRNQMNLNKDLNGTELKHLQIHSTAIEEMGKIPQLSSIQILIQI